MGPERPKKSESFQQKIEKYIDEHYPADLSGIKRVFDEMIGTYEHNKDYFRPSQVSSFWVTSCRHIASMDGLRVSGDINADAPTILAAVKKFENMFPQEKVLSLFDKVTILASAEMRMTLDELYENTFSSLSHYRRAGKLIGFAKKLDS